MLLDLTHLITPEMPMYPGSPAPALAPMGPFAQLGFRETALRLSSHTGTHMDAPSHMLRDGTTLDKLPLSRFCGQAACLDVSGLGAGAITAGYLQSKRRVLDAADFVLFYTGWEARRHSSACLESGFPTPDEEAARYLVSCGLKGVGTDALSIDPLESADYPAHRTLLGAGLVVIEGLCLQKVAGREGFSFLALPLKFENADGAPVRAMAELRELPAEKEMDKT